MTKTRALMSLARTTTLATAAATLALFLTACQGHYNPRLHVDDAPPPPGHVKQYYYNQ